ncbi:MAG: DUF4352 domain-containing protein [Mycolicibacterium cosmeticum]|nr:DUF4352 domain-containing protein [Mycolicibacterium cosmeticum]
MTTPPTPAGWYPDPDGTGGQRYWDGAAWTEHQAPPAAPPAAPAPDEPRSWPSELPPWPSDMEMPSWEKAASEQPTSVVRISQPESQDPEPETVTPEPVDEVAEPVTETPEPDEPPAALEPETTVVKLPEPPTTPYPTYTPPPGFGEPQASPYAEPAAFQPAAAPAGNGNLVKGYLGGVGVLLIALIATLVYALVIHKPDTNNLSLPGISSSEDSSSSAETSAKKSSSPETESPTETAAPSAGEAVDGDVTFTQNGIEVGPTITAADNDLLSKTATGEFVVVHLTLLNNGESPATFIAEQQILTADGQTYTPDTEATFYLGGTTSVVYPGEPVEVAIAYDVPPGSVPESLQVHGDISSAGAVLSLS